MAGNVANGYNDPGDTNPDGSEGVVHSNDLRLATVEDLLNEIRRRNVAFICAYQYKPSPTIDWVQEFRFNGQLPTLIGLANMMSTRLHILDQNSMRG